MATVNINIKTDAETKAQAQRIFESMGMTLSKAINLFLKQSVKANNLPFVIGTAYRDPEDSQSQAPRERRKPMYGCAKDKIWIADDFDSPLNSVE
jgi:DNA-damage-inducible protein J